MLVNSRLERAWSYYQLNQTGAAIALLKELLGEDPNQAEYHGLLAACLLEERRIHAAEYEISVALKLNPEMPFLYLIMSGILIGKNQFNKALDLCNKALSLMPDFVDAHLRKSHIQLLMNRYEDAKNSIREAAAINPDSINVTLAFANFYLTMGENKQAEIYILEALHQDPQNEKANIGMGKIQLARGNIAEAEYHAKFVILNNPHSEEGLALFANIKARSNWFLGLWWKINNKLANTTQLKQVTYLICGYLFFNLFSQILEDLGYPVSSKLVGYAWLGLVVYSWVGMPIYIKMLKKELDKFQFNRNF